jgi:hypothetical protein
VSAIDVQSSAVYVAFCGPCTQNVPGLAFGRGLATNVVGIVPPTPMSGIGWHIASARGLPNRYIMGLAIDPLNIRRVYVALGGYSVRWMPPGTLKDLNTNAGSGHLFVSDDGGENFRDISGNLPDVPATTVVLRGKQVIVGTDVGVFAAAASGGTTYAVLGTGLPVVPISTMQLAPGDCNTIMAATYGRGIYKFAFAKPLPGRNPCDAGGAGGRPLESLVPPERVHSGSHAWWGGSQSEANGHMTLSLTLPATASQLKFWTWYNLEDGYDWAYALISADGGLTWTSLLTTGTDGSGTSALDPIGTVGAVGGNKRYPNGFTGASGSQPTFSGQELYAPIYSLQTADISTFAGRPILLRFAYTSDPATDLAGFYVDDLSIVNALGQALVVDAMEAIGAWQAAGSPAFRLVTRTP